MASVLRRASCDSAEAHRDESRFRRRLSSLAGMSSGKLDSPKLDYDPFSPPSSARAGSAKSSNPPSARVGIKRRRSSGMSSGSSDSASPLVAGKSDTLRQLKDWGSTLVGRGVHRRSSNVTRELAAQNGSPPTTLTLLDISQAAQSVFEKRSENSKVAGLDLKSVMTTALDFRVLSPADASAIATMAFGETVQKLVAWALPASQKLENSADEKTDLLRVFPTLVATGVAVVKEVTALFTQIAQVLYSGGTAANLLPASATSGRSPRDVLRFRGHLSAAAMCNFVIFTLLELEGLFEAFFKPLEWLAENGELRAKAQAVKRDVTLLQGSLADQVTAPLMLAIPLLQVVAM